MAKKKFPNGFDNWQETHFEIVSFITRELDKEGDPYDPPAVNEITTTRDTHGTGGLYELAEEWTDEFEKLHAGREWDGEYFDEVEAFCNSHIEPVKS